ncbi:CBM 14 and Glyco hydro 18 domain containing prote in [Trichuris trichiura]|uniref:CBM 14 and Glyco hydro 18 domain containing prote in n=1 Tax=Trichuris trichiura TaxID=36087 RepID=A0A077ZCP3_TRITR|nr:CBM 14 and Glyco hydro 18 domain containing prote in [Trichuris trichiura]
MKFLSFVEILKGQVFEWDFDLFQVSAAARTSDRHSEKHQSKDNFVRGCYMVNWAQYRPYNGSYFAKDYETGLCTHVFLAFATLSDKYEVTTSEWNDIGSFYDVMKEFKRQDPNLKVLLSLGGWSFGTKKFKKVASSSKLKNSFVASLMRFLRKHSFDGFDLDWEYPDTESDRRAMAIAERIHWEKTRGRRPQLILTAAVAASQDKIEKGYDVPALARYVDFVNVMTYDFHGSWEKRTGINSPLFAGNHRSYSEATMSTSSAVNFWVAKGMPREKIIVGLPTYGRGWTLLNPSDFSVGSKAIDASLPLNYTRAPGVIAFYESCELLKQGAKSFRDKETGSVILVRENQWFSYDDTESFTQKLRWIKENHFGGAFVWSLDTDDFKGIFCPQYKGMTYPLVRTMSAILSNKENGLGVSERRVFLRSTHPSPVKVLPDSFSCPDDGLFANPLDDHSFYNCSNRIPVKKYCENGTSFSSENKICSQPSQPTLRPFLKPQNWSMVSSTAFGVLEMAVFFVCLSYAENIFLCPSDGIFPDPATCDSFYSCAFDRAYLMTCSAGTLFNPEIGTCDHAYNVSCLATASGAVYLKKTDVAILDVTNRSWLYFQCEPFSAEEEKKNVFIRGCYFTNWSQYRPESGKYLPENYEDGLCDYIFFAFAWMKDTFEITNFEWNDIDTLYKGIAKLKSRDSNLKTLLSIGGWTFGTRKFKTMAFNSENRQTFIKSVIEYLRRHEFDGLDIDWEYPENEEDKRNMVKLFQEVRDSFIREKRDHGKSRLLLTAAVSASQSKIDTVYDVPNLAKLLDFINLMSYDFYGSWDLQTGTNSPLFSQLCDSSSSSPSTMAGAAAHWNARGMPKKKIIIGLPTYGRGWRLKNASTKNLGSPANGPSQSLKYTRESGIASYYECCEMLANGAEQYWNNETRTPYLVKDDQWFSYDNEESFTHKIDWIIREGYGGAFVWSLDMDDFGGTFCANKSDNKKYPLTRLLKALNNV